MLVRKRWPIYVGGGAVVVVLGIAIGIGWLSHASWLHGQDASRHASNVTITVSSPEPLATYRESTITDTVKQLLANPPQQKLDASGFVQFVYAQAGIKLPRTVEEQSQTGTPITDATKLQKGDLVFFSDKPTDTTVTFDGIYMGNQQVTALTTHGIQTFQLTDAYWAPLFRFGVTVSQ